MRTSTRCGLKHCFSIGRLVVFVTLSLVARQIALADDANPATANPPAASAPPGATQNSDWQAAARLTNLIDQELDARWQAERVTPAAPASDTEFLRRVYLDLAGRIPAVSEIHDFLDDASADRRQKVVDRLLASPAFNNHVARTWRAILMPEADTNLQIRVLSMAFEGWLRQQLREGKSYDAVVRTILTTPMPADSNGNNYFNGETAGVIGFFFAKEGKPENLAATTARTLLGTRLECAQCHDHPFAHWKQDQFWQLASFFAGIERRQPDQPFSPLKDAPSKHELKVPDTERSVSATFLDGTAPAWTAETPARAKLAEWITSRDNHLFAKAFANRMWAHFFGVGLVDPVDDFDDKNLPSHPALLTVLSRDFADTGFRVEHLVRAIVLSRAYQLSSETTADNQRDPRRFAAMPVRGLTAEQLFDSLAMAVGYQEPDGDSPQFFLNGNSPRAALLETFTNQRDRPIDYHTSIIQAMALMNGSFVADATVVPRSLTLGAISRYPQFDDSSRIETLYLATLSRLPAAQEVERAKAHLAKTPGNLDGALGDVLWALLNSSEFLFNH